MAICELHKDKLRGSDCPFCEIAALELGIAKGAVGAAGDILELEEVVARLRGQLQNAVNHLERAKRQSSRTMYDDAIESANKALYETLNN